MYQLRYVNQVSVIYGRPKIDAPINASQKIPISTAPASIYDNGFTSRYPLDGAYQAQVAPDAAAATQIRGWCAQARYRPVACQGAA